MFYLFLLFSPPQPQPQPQNLEIPYNYSLNTEEHIWNYNYKKFLKNLLNILKSDSPLNTLFKGQIDIIERQLVIYEMQSQALVLLSQYKLRINDKDFNQALQHYCENLSGFKKF
ncbi:MAG: hypothetical protein KME50_10165 [Nostoc desertorum CM1-VF14]|jgi:hypothetical protein|nr:hypothetical protein [Nostoc desertorum CM1-VF14]